MTVSRHRRRMSTTRAIVASLVGVGLALVLGVAGAVAIYHTKDGQVQGSDTPEVQFPATPTGVIAVLDGDGRLASLAVLTVQPPPDDGETGTGGTVVPIPVSSDVSGGIGAERLPLDETVSLFGPESLGDEVAALLGVSIDDVAAVTGPELASLLAPIEPMEVTLPRPATASDGSMLVDAGVQQVDGQAAAAILAARDPSVRGADDYEVDVAVWSAIAAAVGEGLDTPLALAAESGVSGGDGSVGATVAQVTSGTIAVPLLRSDPIVSVDVNPRGVDALALDRVDIAVVFGHVAPGRVAAPYPGYTFRVVSAYGDAQLPVGIARLDVAYTAVKTLFGIEANVRSVETAASEAPVATIIEVVNDEQIAAAERLSDVFGAVEVRVADTRIAGVDMIVTLGTDYLAALDTSVVADTTVPAGSAPGGTVGGEESQGTTVEGTS